MSTTDAVATCYRHPKREAPLGCTRCGNPICLDDAVNAPVGYLCPDCARQPERVRRAQASVGRALDATATRALLVMIGVAFVAQTVLRSSGVVSLVQEGAVAGAPVAAGDWYRLVTAGFLHSGLLHVGLNAYLLYLLGQLVEGALGSGRFLAIYLAGLLGGSAGAILLSYQSFSIGASGAVFGLMGGAMIGLRSRGINPWQSQIGTLVIFNLVFTFLPYLFPSMGLRISVGGHLGGILGGALAGLAIYRFHGDRRRVGLVLAWVVVAALGVAGIVAAGIGPLPFQF